MWRSLVSRLNGVQEAAGSNPVTRTMIAEHYRWNGEKASHLKGFGNFLFSKFFGNSIDEITDGRGFEPLVFHIQGIFAVSALFQRAAAAGFQKNRRKIFHKIMGAGLLVFTNQVQRLFCAQKGRWDWRYDSVFWALPVSTQWHIHSECLSSNTNKRAYLNSTFCLRQKRAAFPKNSRKSGSKRRG